MRKYINKDNIITLIVILFIVSMFVFPQVKSTMIQGLMKIGLFQPNVSSDQKTEMVAANGAGIQFENQDGQLVSLASLKGKVVFINFWATWCPPCIAEMPSIDQLQKKYQSTTDFVILMVDVDDKLEKSVKFMQRKKFNLMVYTPASAIPSNLLSGSIPTTIMLNKKGKIVFKHEGGADYTNSEFISFIDDLIKE